MTSGVSGAGGSPDGCGSAAPAQPCRGLIQVFSHAHDGRFRCSGPWLEGFELADADLSRPPDLGCLATLIRCGIRGTLQ